MNLSNYSFRIDSTLNFMQEISHRTNISILEEIGVERELMGKVARMKLQYFGHVTRRSAGNLALTVSEGNVDGLRYQGRPKRQWMDDIEEWSGCSYI